MYCLERVCLIRVIDSELEKIINTLYKYRSISKYVMYSLIVTIIDVSIVYLIRRFILINIIIANTVGVVVGFLIHYFLSIKNVFAMKSDRIVFFVYFATFLMGLALANYVIWIFYEVFKTGFFVSKGASVTIPFFAMYSIRKAIYSNIQKKST